MEEFAHVLKTILFGGIPTLSISYCLIIDEYYSMLIQVNLTPYFFIFTRIYCTLGSWLFPNYSCNGKTAGNNNYYHRSFLLTGNNFGKKYIVIPAWKKIWNITQSS